MESEQRLKDDLYEVLTGRTRVSTAGFPYLYRSLWARLRDWVPMLLADGPQVLRLVKELATQIGPSCEPNVRIIRQVVRTAAVTAPSDLWLMRHIQSSLQRKGITERFLNDEVIHPQEFSHILGKEIEIDFRFLLSRGTLIRQGEAYRLADHIAAKKYFEMHPSEDSEMSLFWSGLKNTLSSQQIQRLEQHTNTKYSTEKERGIWHPTAYQIDLASQLVPLVVALKGLGKLDEIVSERKFRNVFRDPNAEEFATTILERAGLLDGDRIVSEMGIRVLSRGPGPFGIIETYRQYLSKLEAIWEQGKEEIWVERTANVAASQTANRKSFIRANDALDDFCEELDFKYTVFIEHAVGKGEAIRQRAIREKEDVHLMKFVGADLEDKAIDAAEQEREAGELPASTFFVRHADIGEPQTLLRGLADLGIEPRGAVMMVGNGFHEVRGKDDAAMIEVFRGYEKAGIILIFTEESALSIDDLLETAFNTYHAGFRYVHERSGQALRPGSRVPTSIFEGKRPLSWAECALKGGYVRANRYCQSSRTVYPYTPANGYNPTISAEHFFVPKSIAENLKL